MRSSAVQAVRGLIVLACMVVLPVVALFGVPLPQEMVALWTRSVGHFPRTAEKRQMPDAPFWEHAAANDPHLDAPQWIVPPGNSVPAMTSGSAVSTSATGQTRQSPANPAIPIPPNGGILPGHETASPGLASGPNRPIAGGQPQSQQVGSGTHPAEYGDANYQDSAGGGQMRLPASTTTQTSSDRFDNVQRRLQELGATYYLLETWGLRGDLFRFHCRMAVGENPSYTRQFEATDGDPLMAMERVLRDIEAWSTSRVSRRDQHRAR